MTSNVKVSLIKARNPLLSTARSASGAPALRPPKALAASKKSTHWGPSDQPHANARLVTVKGRRARRSQAWTRFLQGAGSGLAAGILVGWGVGSLWGRAPYPVPAGLPTGLAHRLAPEPATASSPDRPLRKVHWSTVRPAAPKPACAASAPSKPELRAGPPQPETPAQALSPAAAVAERAPAIADLPSFQPEESKALVPQGDQGSGSSGSRGSRGSRGRARGGAHGPSVHSARSCADKRTAGE